MGKHLGAVRDAWPVPMARLAGGTAKMPSIHLSCCLPRETEALRQSHEPVAELGNDPRSPGCCRALGSTRGGPALQGAQSGVGDPALSRVAAILLG